MTTPAPSPAWQTAFALLRKHEQAEPPERHDDGVWTQELSFVLSSAGSVLRHLPGTWVRVYESVEEMIDGTGSAVDVETEDEMWACDEERAIFTFLDHWQAGLLGKIFVFPDETSYREARFEMWQQRCPPEDDDVVESHTTPEVPIAAPKTDGDDDLPF